MALKKLLSRNAEESLDSIYAKNVRMLEEARLRKIGVHRLLADPRNAKKRPLQDDSNRAA